MELPIYVTAVVKVKKKKLFLLGTFIPISILFAEQLFLLGISRSSLYDTYGDMHSLFVKALQQYRKEKIDEVIEMLHKTEDAEEYVKNLFYSIKTRL